MNQKSKRLLLKQYQAVPISREYEEQARIINALIPLLVERLTEEEFDELWAQAVISVMSGKEN